MGVEEAEEEEGEEGEDGTGSNRSRDRSRPGTEKLPPHTHRRRRCLRGKCNVPDVQRGREYEGAHECKS